MPLPNNTKPRRVCQSEDEWLMADKVKCGIEDFQPEADTAAES